MRHDERPTTEELLELRSLAEIRRSEGRAPQRGDKMLTGEELSTLIGDQIKDAVAHYSTAGIHSGW